MASSAPFGLILPSRPVLVDPQTISQTQYAFSFPASPRFSHLVVFLIPNPAFSLPEGTVAGVYIQFPGSEFTLLGAIGNEKQSAIFKVSPASFGQSTEAVMDTGSSAQIQGMSGNITVGISVEPVTSISGQIQQLEATKATGFPSDGPLRTKVLAQRIIKNAFNFLASFAGSVGPGGQEVVPLKSFQDWWTKFERRIENDPGFLEKDDN